MDDNRVSQDLEPITREGHSSNELSARQNPQLQQG
jgi:hypothetical protein